MRLWFDWLCRATGPLSMFESLIAVRALALLVLAFVHHAEEALLEVLRRGAAGLWEAKRDGILVHVEDAGYWIAGVELPQTAIDRAAVARSERRRNRPKGTNPGRRPGGRHGALPKLTAPQIDLARKMLRSGKPATDVATQFGVSIATMKK